MRVLLIGGTGNISSACVRELQAAGHAVGIVSRTGANLPPGCASIVADRYQGEAFAAALAGRTYDVAINFLGFDTPELALDYGLFNGRVKQYIFISSATVYAKPHRFTPINERHPLGNPFSDYARKKQACEDWLLARHRDDGFPVAIVRPSHTYSEQWLPNVVKSAGYTFGDRLRRGKPVFVPGDGGSRWTLTTSADFARGLVGLVGLDAAIGECYHITSDEALSWLDIYTLTARALEAPAPEILRIPVDFLCREHPPLVAGLKGDKAEDGVFDNARIKRAVPGFGCRQSFAEGVAQSVAWFDADDRRKVVDRDVDALFDRLVDTWRNGPKS